MPYWCIIIGIHDHNNHIWTIEGSGIKCQLGLIFLSLIAFQLSVSKSEEHDVPQLAKLKFLQVGVLNSLQALIRSVGQGFVCQKGEEYMEQLWQIHVATLTNPCNNRWPWCWQSLDFDKLVFRFRCKPSLGQLATAEESKAGARLRQQTAPFYDYNQSTTKIQPITVKMQPNTMKKKQHSISKPGSNSKYSGNPLWPL